MADHALLLMQAIEAALMAAVPLAGGWHATRLETPSYPVGYIDLTGSNPGHGQRGYTETHRGVVSVWTQPEPITPEQAMQLSKAAHLALGAGIIPQGNIAIKDLHVGPLIPSNPDALTWGRTFTFTATTYEA